MNERYDQVAERIWSKFPERMLKKRAMWEALSNAAYVNYVLERHARRKLRVPWWTGYLYVPEGAFSPPPSPDRYEVIAWDGFACWLTTFFRVRGDAREWVQKIRRWAKGTPRNPPRFLRIWDRERHEWIH